MQLCHLAFTELFESLFIVSNFECQKILKKILKKILGHFCLQKKFHVSLYLDLYKPQGPKYSSRYPVEGQVVTLSWNWVVIFELELSLFVQIPYLRTYLNLWPIEQTLPVKFYLFPLKALFLIHKCVYESTPYNLFPC